MRCTEGFLEAVNAGIVHSPARNRRVQLKSHLDSEEHFRWLMLPLAGCIHITHHRSWEF